ncbi:MAG: DUF3850 domain-containing protein [Pseudomonadota bacterium]
MRHELKTWPEPFFQIMTGLKTFEIRKEDGRTFDIDDELLLREWDEHAEVGFYKEGELRYTGRELNAYVTHLVRGPEWDVPEGMVIMSIILME